MHAAPLRLPVSTHLGASTTLAEYIARASTPTHGIDSSRHEAQFTASVLTRLNRDLDCLSAATLAARCRTPAQSPRLPRLPRLPLSPVFASSPYPDAVHATSP